MNSLRGRIQALGPAFLCYIFKVRDPAPDPTGGDEIFLSLLSFTTAL